MTLDAVTYGHHRHHLSYFVLILQICEAALTKHSVSAEKSIQQTISTEETLQNTTYLLNHLLAEENYDKEIRPGYGGPPVIIRTDIEIRSMGPISETDMIYSMDCYFRQTWYDERLVFGDDPKKELSMDWKFLQKLWVPDSYFVNGKHSYLHKITVPNKFLRVRADGRLKYSMRLTIKASCPMHLRKYPLDLQICPLEVGSFAFTDRNVKFTWASDVPVVMAPNVTLSQYEIQRISAYNRTVINSDGEKVSTAMVNFHLYRQHGYFILQIYIPCGLIVAASWVAFWIDREAVPARVTLGVTTILTMTTLGFGGKSNLPRTSYATALDVFVILCFGFVFSAMIEYACVNYVEAKENLKLRRMIQRRRRESPAVRVYEEVDTANINQDGEEEITTETEQIMNEFKVEMNPDVDELQSGCFSSFKTLFRNAQRHISTRQDMNVLELDGSVYTSRDRASQVDLYSRKLFPLVFIVLTLCYWILFTYLIEDQSYREVMQTEQQSWKS